MQYPRFCLILLLLLLCSALPTRAQLESVDTAVVAKVKTEGIQHSQVMDILGNLCDVYGPRLAWSPEYKRGAEWVGRKFKEWGLQNVAYDRFAPVGKGWTLKSISATVTSPVPYPVIAYAAAWSPGIKEREAEVVQLDVRNPEDFARFHGKLKGKFVLISPAIALRPHFEPLGFRLADSLLLKMANASAAAPRRGARRFPRLDVVTAQNIDSVINAARLTFPDMDPEAMRERLIAMLVGPEKIEFAQKEGALAVITAGRGDGGTVLVQSATVPQPANTPRENRIAPYNPQAPEIIPQVVFASEHYNRMVRMLERGEKVRLQMALEVETTKADSGFNITAEIPGTDLKDEVVMIGAHFDTWHAGTGATDNGTGSAACMEAMRILRVLMEKEGVKPRRTIRVGLWCAEEEGLIGSREYVTQTFARREGAPSAGGFGEIKKMPGYDNLSVYLNHDNGSGRIRGIYLQGNEAARSIFRSWFAAYGDPAAQTITIQNTGGTDHQSFDAVGLPGFQFIQDPLEYDSRTHHYNMDVYDRIQEDDMKQAASIMAFFAYSAAMRDGKFPRKPLPTPAASR